MKQRDLEILKAITETPELTETRAAIESFSEEVGDEGWTKESRKRFWELHNRYNEVKQRHIEKLMTLFRAKNPRALNTRALAWVHEFWKQHPEVTLHEKNEESITSQPILGLREICGSLYFINGEPQNRNHRPKARYESQEVPPTGPYALISQPKRRLAKQYVPIKQVMNHEALQRFAAQKNLNQRKRFGVGLAPVDSDGDYPITYVDKRATLSDFDVSHLTKNERRQLREKLDAEPLQLLIKSSHPPYRQIWYSVGGVQITDPKDLLPNN